MTTEESTLFANRNELLGKNNLTTFVFVAKDKYEFMRYPKDGFHSSKEIFDDATLKDRVEDGRELFRHRQSDKCNVFILDSFDEKKNLSGCFEDEEKLGDFCGIIISYINRILSPDSQDHFPQDVVVFTHWGGGNDESIRKDEQELQKTYQEKIEEYLPGWKFYSLSSLRKDLFNVEGNITIGDDEELQEMLRKFETMYQSNLYAPLQALGLYLRGIVDNQEAGSIPHNVPGIEKFQEKLCKRDKIWEDFFHQEQEISIQPDVAKKMIEDISALLNLKGANHEE